MNLPSWNAAARLAAQTPPERNRYVDFLRAASICLVITGHWLVIAFYSEDGQTFFVQALSLIPWAHWLTWLFQVMPVFFLVGGYVNGLGWASAQRRQLGYADWLAGRLQRLILPVLPLLAVWTLFGAALAFSGVISFGSSALYVGEPLLKAASQFAMLPAWFLVVYILVILLSPVAYRAWKRYGLASFAALAAGAAVVDLLALGVGWLFLSWLNYFFIWLAVHQLGFAWHDGRIGGPRRALLWAAAGLAALIALVTFGPYPVSMVTVQGEEISNSLPPKLPLLALAVAQTGLLLALERPARRLLDRGGLWTAAVLINGMIMTIFLWHVTALLLGLGLTLMTEVGVSLRPGTAAWWLTRPLWIAVLAAFLIPFVAAFTRFERIGIARRAAPPPVWQLLLGCALVCCGLAILTLRGIPTQTWPGINLLALGLPFIGAALILFRPRRARAPGE